MRSLSRDLHDNKFHIACRSIDPQPSANCCAKADLKKNGTKTLFLVDVPHLARPASLAFERQRWKCRECGATIYEKPSFFSAERLMTKRCADWMFDQSRLLPFVRVSEFAGVHEKTVRNIFADHMDAALATIEFSTPRVLGIDEKHVMGSLRGVFGDIEQRCIIEMLPTARATAVNMFLQNLPDKRYVRVVCMDMSKTYLKAAKHHLWQADVVIDKFHVLRYATQAMDIVRKNLRSSISADQRKRLIRERFTLLKRRSSWNEGDRTRFEEWKTTFPQLVDAYRIKEEIHEIFDRQWLPSEARAAFYQWERCIPDYLVPAFRDFTRAVHNWAPHIFNYFEHPYTNAYIERLNGCIDDINVMGRGYSFDVLRARTLLRHGRSRSVRNPSADPLRVMRRYTDRRTTPSNLGRTIRRRPQNYAGNLLIRRTGNTARVFVRGGRLVRWLLGRLDLRPRIQHDVQRPDHAGE